MHLNQKKKWIAFNSGPEGEIVIDQEAQKLIAEGRSFLLRGISQVNGQFKSGAVIRVLNLNGDEIGLGVVKMSSKELTRFLDSESNCSRSFTTIIEWDNFVYHLDLSRFIEVTS